MRALTPVLLCCSVASADWCYNAPPEFDDPLLHGRPLMIEGIPESLNGVTFQTTITHDGIGHVFIPQGHPSVTLTSLYCTEYADHDPDESYTHFAHWWVHNGYGGNYDPGGGPIAHQWLYDETVSTTQHPLLMESVIVFDTSTLNRGDHFLGDTISFDRLAGESPPMNDFVTRGFTVSVIAVPEPSQVLCMLMAAGLFVMRSARRCFRSRA